MPVETTASGIPLYAVPVLGPALPEIIMAVGVLALVLYGALRGERSTGVVTAAAIALMAFTLGFILTMSGDTQVTFSDAFITDGVRPLHEGAGADWCDRGARHVA